MALLLDAGSINRSAGPKAASLGVIDGVTVILGVILGVIDVVGVAVTVGVTEFVGVID
jgi:hypothetical protein